MRKNIAICPKPEGLPEQLDNQLIDFQQKLNAVSGYYRKTAINIAIGCMVEELGIQNKSEPQEIIKIKPRRNIIFRIGKWIFSHLFPDKKNDMVDLSRSKPNEIVIEMFPLSDKEKIE